MEKLDLAVLMRTLNSLKAIFERYNKEQDIDLRDSVIQRFEYTYSISLKMIMRFFKVKTVENTSIMTFNEIIRTANQYNLLKSNLEIWNNFRLKRNLTSHTYDENIANEVIEIIPDFIEEVEFLFKQLKIKD